MPSKLTSDEHPRPESENGDYSQEKKKQKLMEPDETNPPVEPFDPWNRLNATPTLASSRHEIYYTDHILTPKDKLDFVLGGVYNHTIDYNKTYPQVLIQRETLGEDLGRKLKNREKVSILSKKSELDHPLKVVAAERMEDFNSIKLAIGPQPKSGSGSVFGRKPKVVKNPNNNNNNNRGLNSK